MPRATVGMLAGTLEPPVPTDPWALARYQAIAAYVALVLADQPDEIQAERARLADDIAHLDQRIRKIGLQVANDILTSDDAKAINAPLIARRESLKLRLAALPERKAVPTPERMDPAKFRAAVLRAWATRPLEERRDALGQLIEKVTLSPGGVKITYGYCHHEPAGPPWGSGLINRGWVRCGEVGPPKTRATAMS